MKSIQLIAVILPQCLIFFAMVPGYNSLSRSQGGSSVTAEKFNNLAIMKKSLHISLVCQAEGEFDGSRVTFSNHLGSDPDEYMPFWGLEYQRNDESIVDIEAEFPGLKDFFVFASDRLGVSLNGKSDEDPLGLTSPLTSFYAENVKKISVNQGESPQSSIISVTDEKLNNFEILYKDGEYILQKHPAKSCNLTSIEVEHGSYTIKSAGTLEIERLGNGEDIDVEVRSQRSSMVKRRQFWCHKHGLSGKSVDGIDSGDFLEKLPYTGVAAIYVARGFNYVITDAHFYSGLCEWYTPR